jgi:hypothetical protein
MAVTPAALQAELDTTGKGPTILRSNPYDTTLDSWYVHGGIPYAGRALWINTTASESAADQATAVRTALAAFR